MNIFSKIEYELEIVISNLLKHFKTNILSSIKCKFTIVFHHHILCSYPANRCRDNIVCHCNRNMMDGLIGHTDHQAGILLQFPSRMRAILCNGICNMVEVVSWGQFYSLPNYQCSRCHHECMNNLWNF